jgi:hypothetical protein
MPIKYKSPSKTLGLLKKKKRRMESNTDRCCDINLEETRNYGKGMEPVSKDLTLCDSPSMKCP